LEPLLSYMLSSLMEAVTGVELPVADRHLTFAKQVMMVH